MHWGPSDQRSAPNQSVPFLTTETAGGTQSFTHGSGASVRRERSSGHLREDSGVDAATRTLSYNTSHGIPQHGYPITYTFKNEQYGDSETKTEEMEENQESSEDETEQHTQPPQQLSATSNSVSREARPGTAENLQQLPSVSQYAQSPGWTQIRDINNTSESSDCGKVIHKYLSSKLSLV